MLRKTKNMPEKYCHFFRKQLAAARVMGLEKGVTFGKAWMYDHDGEWRRCACGFVGPSLVEIHISWGRKLNQSRDIANFRITRGSTGPSVVCMSIYLEGDKTFEGCENKLADVAMFGEPQ